MNDAEQQNLLRAFLDPICAAAICSDGIDFEKIGRTVFFFACALDCPSVAMTPRELAEKLGISRQYLYRMVDKKTLELAEIKANQRSAVDTPLPKF